jgi:alkanesulfonate monooxygenase SsuD/methylene tetrahydromethanopterin reductase-like flavin-dependent oxidoreductase (luciferase family)
MQLWPGKSPERLYAEVEEQIVHADRLGYDAYAIVEHFFFPKFSISPDPLALFAQVAPRTQRIRFRTMLHVLPFHNPTVLASRIAAAQILTGGRYEFGVGRGHGWAPPKAGVRLADVRELYDESFEVFFKALENERFSHEGRFYEVHDSHLAPPPPPPDGTRVFVGGTSDSTYELAGRRGWAVAVPPLLPYEALRGQLDIYRQSCAEHGNEPDIVWIHACYMDEDREVAKRDAEQAMRRFLQGNASPLAELGPVEDLQAAGYGFYTSGIMEQLAATPYDEMIDGDVVWVGTPEDITARVAGIIDACEGLTEIAITANPGGFAHWQAIKTQEIFADEVAPRFRSTDPAATGAARKIATHA